MEKRLIIMALIVGALLALLSYLVRTLDGFFVELRRLELEIERSTGEEKKHWARRKRRLLWSLVPFCRY